MTTALEHVDIRAEQLKELLPMKLEDKQRLDKKLRLEFNYNSNHMEGNTLTYGETELLLIFDDTKGNHSMREYEEMKAHDVAYHMVEDWANDKERPLTERDIKNLNDIILVRPFWKDAVTPDGQPTRRMIKVGDYKEHPNSVRLQNGEVFEYASPSETPIKMQELIDWYRTEENVSHPVTLAAMLHYRFVRIHPFDDGNGRVSRLLMNYVLLRNNLPSVVIKSDDKVNYLRALNRADAGDYEAFIDYIAQQVAWSLELTIKAAKGESIEEQNDWEKKLHDIKAQVSQKEQLKKMVSAHVVKEVVLHSIVPLVEIMITKLAKFDELFSRKKLVFFKGGTRIEIGGAHSIAEQVNSKPEEFYKDGHLQFSYELNGFNKDKNPFSSSASIYWAFENYKYYTGVNNNDYDKRKEHFYHEFYTKEEIDTYVNECANAIVEEIERQVNQNIE